MAWQVRGRTWEKGRSKDDRTMKLLILSDIHGNWPALEAVLRRARR